MTAGEVGYMVRRAEEKDIAQILKLLVQVNMVHHLGRPDLFNGPATKYTGPELAEILKDPARPVFVYAEEDGTVKGHAFCWFEQCIGDNIRTDVKTLYIDDICVDEEARGQHVGTALYEYVEAFAKAEGCYNVTLNVWECNPGARKFYEACGMVPQKTGMEKILR